MFIFSLNCNLCHLYVKRVRVTRFYLQPSYFQSFNSDGEIEAKTEVFIISNNPMSIRNIKPENLNKKKGLTLSLLNRLERSAFWVIDSSALFELQTIFKMRKSDKLFQIF